MNWKWISTNHFFFFWSEYIHTVPGSPSVVIDLLFFFWINGFFNLSIYCALNLVNFFLIFSKFQHQFVGIFKGKLIFLKLRKLIFAILLIFVQKLIKSCKKQSFLIKTTQLRYLMNSFQRKTKIVIGVKKNYGNDESWRLFFLLIKVLEKVMNFYYKSS